MNSPVSVPSPSLFYLYFPFQAFKVAGSTIIQIWISMQVSLMTVLPSLLQSHRIISMEDILSTIVTIPHQGLNHASFGPPSACILWIHMQNHLKNRTCALHNLKVFHIYIFFRPLKVFLEQQIYCLFLFLLSHLVPSCRRESLWKKISSLKSDRDIPLHTTRKRLVSLSFFTFLGFVVVLSFFV